MEAKIETWCDRDDHKFFEYYADFNEWLESSDSVDLLETYGLANLSFPSKVFYVSDKEAYNQAFQLYRENRRNETLNAPYLSEQFSGQHWFERNLRHFDQLVEQLGAGNVVPFIGAGLSVGGGFPSWEEHLHTQGRTAGIDTAHIEALLANGEYEQIIAEIEAIRGREVFAQEIRDVFSHTGNITNTTFLVTDLFADTIITTNYDRLIEQAFDTGGRNSTEVIAGFNALKRPDPRRTSIIKLHGDVKNSGHCILSKNQYDKAYGNNEIDMQLPIPKCLEYYYINSCMLFLGCSLNNDRTVQVFRAIKKRREQNLGEINQTQHFVIEQAPETEQALIERNAYLLSLGITGIWFEKERFECIDDILRLARDELRYRGISPAPHRDSTQVANSEVSQPKFLQVMSDFAVRLLRLGNFR